jgi:hypothetical protein
MGGRPPRGEYLRRANLFADAVEISNAVLKDVDVPEAEPLVEGANELRDKAFGVFTEEELAVAPDLPRLTLRGLRYLEEALLTYWNEASGPHVERFWRLIADRGLPYERTDHIAAVLARGNIRTRIEYEAVTDGLVVYQQLGRLTAAEAGLLSDAIGKYERRSRS